MKDICSYTLAHYSDTIRKALDLGYTFVTFDDLRAGDAVEPFILLRHDIDMKLQPAEAMRKEEEHLGIRSTWFFRTRAVNYNLMSDEAGRLLSALILQNNAELGLHIDGVADALYEVALWKAMMRAWMGDIEAGDPFVTSHDPGRAEIGVGSKSPYERLFVDAPALNLYGLTYISDSSHQWRDGSMCWYIERQTPKLYILVHPQWWFKIHSGEIY